MDYYPDYTRLTPRSARSGLAQERLFYSSARAIIFSSAWARDQALRHSTGDSEHFFVVPFGANVEPCTKAGATRDPSRSQTCHLLFLGVDWIRKRGDFAVAVMRALRHRGVLADLTIIGGGSARIPEDPAIRSTGFLDLSNSSDRRRLSAELLRAHFLIHPAAAEAYGIALCEAAAHSLPALATATGGIPTIVKHGVTGLLFSPTEGPAAYAAAVENLWRDPSAYAAMSLAARHEFQKRLNWSVAARAALDVLSSALATP
jgi:glycosyltransferase involved in cell wall biosynthesis